MDPRLRRRIFIWAITIFPVAGSCHAAPVALPLDAAASKVSFIGDSFLHSFHGEASEFTGSATLDTDAAPPLQKASIAFKTTALTTFQSTRDAKMKDWLKVSAHPEATFSLEKVRLVEGDYEKADSAHRAKFMVSGIFTLNGIKQPMSGPAVGWREANHVLISGESTIETLKYGLPQIREAFMTVGTNVKVTYHFVFVLPAEYSLK
jgi:polyisoprenoid-binding protein YceI